MSFSAHRRHHMARKRRLLSCCFLITAERALLMRFPFAPTICVRPGKPNLAASSFSLALSVNRLMVLKQFCQSAMMCVIGMPRPVLQRRFLTHAATLDLDALGSRRALNMPGVSCTVAEQIEALRSVAGNDVVKLIKPELDERIVKIVAGWPRDFQTDRAHFWI